MKRESLDTLFLVLIIIGIAIGVGYLSVKSSTTPQDTIWGILDQGIQFNGGSRCETVDETTTCVWNVIVSWPDADPTAD